MLSLGLSCLVKWYSINMKTGIVTTIGIVSFIAMVAMLYLTHPGEVGPFGVLTFFVFLYVLCSCIIYLLLKCLAMVLLKILPKGTWRLRLEELGDMKVYYYTSALALAPVVLLGMASVGGLRGLDVALVLLFELIACFYISHRF